MMLTCDFERSVNQHHAVGCQLAKCRATVSKQGVATAPPTDSVPFLVTKDTVLVNWASASGKVTLCMADLMCKLASERGIMQVTLADHDMQPMVKDC